MRETRVRYLLQQFAAGKASAQEVEEMLALLQQAKGEEELKKLVLKAKDEAEQHLTITEEEWGGMWNAIALATFRKRRVMLFMPGWAKAAAVLVVAAGIGLFMRAKKNVPQPVVVAKQQPLPHDVPPGGNKALLTLADGSTIILDSANNGALAQQGGTKVLKINAGQLSYKTGTAALGQVLFNTIATPRGGQYEVTLADGTEVWLNAASTLRFPTAFAGNTREVELTGEAYFEVAKNPAKPFHVKVNQMDVQVLGTHFNIMAYGNEPAVKTTLLEGKVTVTNNGQTQQLVPGQQAALNGTNGFTVRDVNTDFAVAWKNGLFRFKETNIREIMRQVERWYDVEVDFKALADDQDYTGIVPRTQNVSALLQMLQLTGTVHFTVEGRKITVQP